MSFTRLRSLSLAIIVMPVGIASAQLPPAPYVAPAPILNQVLRWSCRHCAKFRCRLRLGVRAAESSETDSTCAAPIRWSIRRVASRAEVTCAAIVTRSARRSRASRSTRVRFAPGRRWAALRHLGVALGAQRPSEIEAGPR